MWIELKESDLQRIEDLQHAMEKKHCHQLEYSDGQPQFFVSGLPEANETIQL